MDNIDHFDVPVWTPQTLAMIDALLPAPLLPPMMTMTPPPSTTANANGNTTTTNVKLDEMLFEDDFDDFDYLLLSPSLLFVDPLFNLDDVVVGTNTNTAAATIGTTTTLFSPPLLALQPQPHHHHHDGLFPFLPQGGALHRTAPTPTPTPTLTPTPTPSNYYLDTTTGHFYRPATALESHYKDTRQVPQLNQIFDMHRSVVGGFKTVAPLPNTYNNNQPGTSHMYPGAPPSSTVSQQIFPFLVTTQMIPQQPHQQQQKQKPQHKEMVGVMREPFSLHWSAFIAISLSPPPHSSSTQASPPTATPTPTPNTTTVHLGNWPLRDHAARAHDIAALKAFGETKATLNFPLSEYQTIMPSITLRTWEQVLEALRNASTLSMKKTSKFSGVRRVGVDQYQAFIPVKQQQ